MSRRKAPSTAERHGTQLALRRQAFALEYLKDFDAKAAAIRAGFAESSAAVSGSKMLREPEVQRLLLVARKEFKDEALVTIREVIEELRHQAFLDPADLFDNEGKLLDVPAMPERARRAIAGLDLEHVKTSTTRKGESKEEADEELEVEVESTKKVKLNDKLKALELLGRYLKMFTDASERTVARVRVIDLTGEQKTAVEVEVGVER